ncbi:MAG: peptide ABC transporter permease [Sulfobacillus acidophilus]|uniref:Peptide ABC transporter permease n=1 Tax=Sulfobacillus acidophilus TaxID=53633 RepID=A0A2T2WJM2_9FIRM|nr:MAG: peptide ABC transporter permease [Sulfobacillus acidophilus]
MVDSTRGRIGREVDAMTETTDIPGNDLELLRTMRSRNNQSWHAFIRNRTGMTGMLIFLLFVALAILAPWIAPGNPSAITMNILIPPNSHYLLGTTAEGQSVLMQTIWGTRSTLLVGLSAGALATLLSIIIGVGGAYSGGLVDDVATLFSNIFIVIPGIPLMIVLTTYLHHAGVGAMILVIAFTGWPFGARVLRSQTLSLRSRDFVRAARLSGEGTWGVVRRELFPNMLSLIIANLLGTIMYAIGAEVSLQFLGLGNINTVSWGTMLYWASNYQALLNGAWWWIIPPGVCIGLIGGALALVNRSIDEISNPQLAMSGRSKKRRLRRKLA